MSSEQIALTPPKKMRSQSLWQRQSASSWCRDEILLKLSAEVVVLSESNHVREDCDRNEDLNSFILYFIGKKRYCC